MILVYDVFMLLQQVASFLFTLEIPTGILLQFTIFTGVQKQKTSGLDILGGALVFIAVCLIPGYTAIQNKIGKQKQDKMGDTMSESKKLLEAW